MKCIKYAIFNTVSIKASFDSFIFYSFYGEDKEMWSSLVYHSTEQKNIVHTLI